MIAENSDSTIQTKKNGDCTLWGLMQITLRKWFFTLSVVFMKYLTDVFKSTPNEKLHSDKSFKFVSVGWHWVKMASFGAIWVDRIIFFVKRFVRWNNEYWDHACFKRVNRMLRVRIPNSSSNTSLSLLLSESTAVRVWKRLTGVQTVSRNVLCASSCLPASAKSFINGDDSSTEGRGRWRKKRDPNFCQG